MKQQIETSHHSITKSVVADYPKRKLTIVGAGIVGFLEAYYAYLEAYKRGERVRVTIYDKNDSLKDTTTAHIVPSLTPDEILSVVPRGSELIIKLRSLFSEPGGIRVDDAPGVNDSISANSFKRAVQEYGQDEEGHQARTETLLALGKMSMDLWQEIYVNADVALQNILIASNFNPCGEPRIPDEISLHDGYRIDLIYNVHDALKKANAMKSDYERLGYKYCKILSPDEVVRLDPFLADFCNNNSRLHEEGARVWKHDAVALWRPGGCIDTQVFLPLFHNYLKKQMGQYTNESGIIKDCFQLRLGRKIEQVTYEIPQDTAATNKINGLKFFANSIVKHNKHDYQQSDYVFTPGEAVGTLKSLGFSEPEYARFAGASLMLLIDLPADKFEKYVMFNHCMEVHQEGVVLAWQARVTNHQVFIGVAGMKAFYGDQQPHKDQAFAKDRNLLQLNIINGVLPEFISWALGKPTQGIKLTQADMTVLENRKIARRWVGTRAVAYDGFPTVGPIYNRKGMVFNARTTTHLGSGGASFAPAAVHISRSSVAHPLSSEQLSKLVLASGTSIRRGTPTDIKSTYYAYQVNEYNKGRWHACEVDSAQFNLQNDKYKALKGDYLKSQILLDFKRKLERTYSKQDLDQLVQALISSEEYKILRSGQGWTTRLFGLKTSSVNAFQKMVKEQEDLLLEIADPAQQLI